MEKELSMYMDPSYYTNRELSWIKFNERVLSEARDKNLPLFERLKFLSITESNLRRGMLASGGSFLQFINRPICLVILAFTVFSLAFTIIRMLKDKAKGKEINEEE